MAKVRMIQTKFWSDNFIVELDPLERYLFLYLLTNEHTEMCGIYELPIKVMARETGIEDDMLLKILLRLTGKISYHDGWVCIKNFSKNQSINDSIKKGIEKSLAQIPQEILAQFTQEQTPTPQGVPTVYTGGGEYKSKSKSKLKSESEYILQPAVAEENKNIVLVFDAFKTINSAIGKMYGNKTQRGAISQLLREYQIDKLLQIVNYALSVQGKQFAPVITTPYQLFMNMAKLKIYYERNKNNSSNVLTL